MNPENLCDTFQGPGGKRAPCGRGLWLPLSPSRQRVLEDTHGQPCSKTRVPSPGWYLFSFPEEGAKGPVSTGPGCYLRCHLRNWVKEPTLLTSLTVTWRSGWFLLQKLLIHSAFFCGQLSFIDVNGSHLHGGPSRSILRHGSLSHLGSRAAVTSEPHLL